MELHIKFRVNHNMAENLPNIKDNLDAMQKSVDDLDVPQENS